MTHFYDGTQNAHVVPHHEVSWFVANNMAQYNLNRKLHANDSIDDVSNGILLRSDLHGLLDTPYIVFVPKRGLWVTHAIMCSYDVQRFYHNRSLHDIADVTPQFVYARFAWALFQFLGPFFCAGGAGKGMDPHSSVIDDEEEEHRKSVQKKRKNSSADDGVKKTVRGRKKLSADEDHDNDSQWRYQMNNVNEPSFFLSSSRPHSTSCPTTATFCNRQVPERSTDHEIDARAGVFMQTGYPLELRKTSASSVSCLLNTRWVSTVIEKLRAGEWRLHCFRREGMELHGASKCGG